MKKKQICVVYKQKPITSIHKKLEEIYVSFWEPHNLAFLSKSIYAAILICKKIKKILILYFCSKDKFIDIFQVWLSKFENESNCIMKTFCVDNRKEFISIKLKIFCEKKILLLNMQHYI